MPMKMKHRLPRVRTAAIEQVHSVGVENLDCNPRDSLRRQGHCSQIIGRDVEQILAVALWHNEKVAIRGRMDVHEGTDPVILDNFHAGNVAGNDSAEHTMISHGIHARRQTPSGAIELRSNALRLNRCVALR